MGYQYLAKTYCNHLAGISFSLKSQDIGSIVNIVINLALSINFIILSRAGIIAKVPLTVGNSGRVFIDCGVNMADFLKNSKQGALLTQSKMFTILLFILTLIIFSPPIDSREIDWIKQYGGSLGDYAVKPMLTELYYRLDTIDFNAIVWGIPIQGSEINLPTDSLSSYFSQLSALLDNKR